MSLGEFLFAIETFSKLFFTFQLDMEPMKRLTKTIGSLRTHGEHHGETRASSKWPETRTTLAESLRKQAIR